MALLDSIPYFKNKKEELKQEIYKLQKNKSSIEKDIAMLKQYNIEELKKQENIKERSKQLKNDIAQLNQKKNELDKMLQKRESFYIETELKYIDTLDGWSFEQYCSNLLQKIGYTSVVTKGSNDYGGDILAEKENIKYVIQCKRYNEVISAKPIGEVLRSIKHYKCEKGIILTNNYFTNNAIEEAQDCDIELWDRNKLIKMLYEAYSFNLSYIDFIEYNASISDETTKDDETIEDYDPFLFNAIEFAIEKGEISTSIIQRHFQIGYARSGRIIDQMEARGVISGYQGVKPRQILISKERWEQLKNEYLK